MILRELLNKFSDDDIYVDICTPIYRQYGAIKYILKDNESRFLDAKVYDWKISYDGVLKVKVDFD